MRMRPWMIWLLLLTFSIVAQAGPARIIKVLPHYLDKEGRHALSPSLYERDAYQAFLRAHPEERSALRFDINWKAKRAGADPLVLQLELRCSGRDLSQPIVLERSVRPARWFSTWSSLELEPQDYKAFGQLIAWRATLRQGDQILAEQKSFLW